MCWQFKQVPFDHAAVSIQCTYRDCKLSIDRECIVDNMDSKRHFEDFYVVFIGKILNLIKTLIVTN